MFGSGSLHFTSFAFSEERGGEHPGLFPLSRDLVVGETPSVVGKIDRGNFNTAAFEFRTKDSINVIKTLDVPRGSGKEFDIPDNMFIGNATVPAGEFLVYVVGETDSGERFRRVLPAVYGNPLNGTGNSTASSSGMPTGIWSNSTTRTGPNTPVMNSTGVIMTVITAETTTYCPVTYTEKVDNGFSTRITSELSTVRVTSTVYHPSAAAALPTKGVMTVM
ncbi:MAG: hypothetical protein M1813_003989 [Trichoglossum hirsutum]|nr:MAG: hypothetical protein M1813_003989 [Trichoglossum hirsutum]